MSLSLLLALIALAAAAVPAPDFGRDEIKALRTAYLAQRQEIDASRKVELLSVLARALEGLRHQQIRAKAAGSAERQKEAAYGIRIITQALTTLEEEGTYAFPPKVYPSLERTVALCDRARQTEDGAREASIGRLENQYMDLLRQELEKQGAAVTDPLQLKNYWEAVRDDKVEALAAPPPAAEGTAEATDMSGASAARPATEAVGNAAGQDVLQTRGEAAQWKPLVQIEMAAGDIEIVSLPVFGLHETVVREGVGFASGGTWKAQVRPLNACGIPAGDPPPLRARSVEGMHTLDVVTWPSQRNDWRVEVRSRPVRGGTPRHAIILEIDQAAIGGL